MLDLKPVGSQDIERINDTAGKFINNVEQVIVNKEETVKLIFIALLSEGHILIEDVPGLGKTMMAKAATKSLGCSFKRIQCTPDLLPSDITGVNYFNQKTAEFMFHPGPIMANIVVVDEINRAMPRTQSCLLEAMQERQITVDLTTMPLPRPFLIIATQNPIELEGTFPLPEAQLDRFLMRLRIGYPGPQEEEQILSRFQEINPLDNLERMTDAGELLELIKICRRIHISADVLKYAVELVRKTRSHKDIKLGASPRAALGLQAAAQARAAVEGRTFVIPDDVKTLAIPVLAHRLFLTTEARLSGKTDETIIASIIEETAVPV
ncbi:MAG TPA: MoxR family ATPase [Smithellaceae bacterium]|nr:MoxR family ATPase [Smithellaceae bacterium]